MIRSILPVLCLILAGCAKAPEQGGGDAAWIGRPVAQVLVEAGLEPDPRLVVDEPPAVPRAVRTRDSAGRLVELYVRRGAVPASWELDWSLQQFADQEVIGIAREDGDGWLLTGDVMLIRRAAAGRP